MNLFQSWKMLRKKKLVVVILRVVGDDFEFEIVEMKMRGLEAL